MDQVYTKTKALAPYEDTGQVAYRWWHYGLRSFKAFTAGTTCDIEDTPEKEK